MAKELADPHLAAWRHFVMAHARLIGQIERDLALAERIPLNWYDVLIELYEAPKQRLRLSELAQKVVLTKSGLTRLVDRLEEAGLLRREPTPDDRRGAYAALTDKGKEALRKAWPVYARGIAQHFARYLSAAEAEVVREAFGRMLGGEDVTG